MMKNKATRYLLNQSPLYKLRSHKKLASLLHIESADIKRLARSDNLYKEFNLPKKAGGTRHVENPQRQLKRTQKRLARLLSRIEPPDYLFCPVKGRSYVSNAAAHNGARVVRCLDIRKYFPNTPSWRVFWFFRTVMRCEADIAETLTCLATYKGHLPTGSPLSPIMAYFAYYDVWEAVAKIARVKGLTLSVYIDDVTVSGSKVSASDLWEIKKVIHASGLRYHKEKHYVGVASEITGVIVHDGVLRVPNRQLKKLHLTKRKLQKAIGTHEETKLKNVVKGLSEQIDQIRKAAG
jgi:hypothetical protein